MKTNNNASTGTNQVFSSQDILERDRLNKERYRKACLEQLVNAPKKRSTADHLEIKYQSLPPIAKMILNQLDSRNLTWSVNPFNQKWLADNCRCSLRWVRHCIARLAKEGFIAILRINRGKAYKTLTGWFKYPNIYVVSPFLRWATSVKLYDVIMAKAEKIQAQFLYLYKYLIKYFKCIDIQDRKTPFKQIKFGSIMNKLPILQNSTA